MTGHLNHRRGATKDSQSRRCVNVEPPEGRREAVRRAEPVAKNYSHAGAPPELGAPQPRTCP